MSAKLKNPAFSCRLVTAINQIINVSLYQCRSKANKSGGGGGGGREAHERWGRESLGWSGSMLPQNILKSRGLEMLFPAFSKSYLRFTHVANYLLCTLSQQTNAH